MQVINPPTASRSFRELYADPTARIHTTVVMGHETGQAPEDPVKRHRIRDYIEQAQHFDTPDAAQTAPYYPAGEQAAPNAGSDLMPPNACMAPAGFVRHAAIMGATAARTLPWMELVIGMLLVAGFLLRYAAPAATILLMVFYAAMIHGYAAGAGIDYYTGSTGRAGGACFFKACAA